MEEPDLLPLMEELDLLPHLEEPDLLRPMEELDHLPPMEELDHLPLMEELDLDLLLDSADKIVNVKLWKSKGTSRFTDEVEWEGINEQAPLKIVGDSLLCANLMNWNKHEKDNLKKYSVGQN